MFAHVRQADGDAGLASATGTANAMHVIFGGTRQIVIDDVGNTLHIDAARGDIGRDQYAQPTLTQ